MASKELTPHEMACVQAVKGKNGQATVHLLRTPAAYDEICKKLGWRFDDQTRKVLYMVETGMRLLGMELPLARRPTRRHRAKIAAMLAEGARPSGQLLGQVPIRERMKLQQGRRPW